MAEPTESILSQLKTCLQDEPVARKLENLAAALLGRLLGVTVAVAHSGFQHGGDAGPSGRQGRLLRLECKRYRDTTTLNERELLGEIDHALSRDPALEAWILVTTRDVPEQLEQSLHLKGETIGVPIVVLDWKPEEIPPLAALCAYGHDLVESLYSTEAGLLAKNLEPKSAKAIDKIRRDLQAWRLGFESLRAQSLETLEKIWQSPRTSNAALGQNAAGGCESRKVRRHSVHAELDTWWSGQARDDAPVALVGWDGVGKTWAALDWLFARRQVLPILLVVPSSAAAEIKSTSETSVKRFLADRLYELSGVRSRDHWIRRLENLLKRPFDEGPVLTVLFDGLNQEPSVPWLPLLKTLQGEAFEGRIRVILSTRTHHFETKVGELRGLVVPAVRVHVNLYDTSPGGELDQMLAFEGLSQADLHPDLIELARTPRLFRLVVRFRERLVEAGQVTIHRLLWEYGRDSFGNRAGRSFSEDEWREWLQEIASRYRDGVRQFSLKTLGETASRADLSKREVYARLSDIIDGQFVTAIPSGNLQLKPAIVAHALAAALLAQLDTVASPTFDTIYSELTQWLDPIAGLDQRAEILRAAVSIVVERSGTTETPVAGVLVTSWLQTQNVTDAHRLELAGLAVSLCEALLDAVEHSAERTHASARLWAVNALRSIQRPNPLVLASIVERSRRWFTVISRNIHTSGHVAAEDEKRRSEYFIRRIGVDASISITVLGLNLQLVDWDSDILPSTVPSLLEGFPLADAAPVFEAAAIAMSVSRHNDSAWNGMQWLCLMNNIDSTETTLALRSLSASSLKRQPEAGVNPALPARVAALLLWLTGEEIDEASAVAIDPGLDRHFTYERDYLSRPSRSIFPLERRHANDALNDKDLPLITRIRLTRDLWLDPDFVPPSTFVEEVRRVAAQIQVDKLHRNSSRTIDDHNFMEFEPVLARCAPELLSDLILRKLQSFSDCPPESRYWCAIQATDFLVLASEAESTAARVLRLSSREATDCNETYAASKLLMLELHQRTCLEQADALIGASLPYILADFTEILRRPTPDEVDTLITHFRDGTGSQRRDLLIFFLHDKLALTDFAWSWLVEIAFGAETDLHGFAYQVLARTDALRFGRELLSRDWTWSACAHYWVNHYGSLALIEATYPQPFDQIVLRLAPWRLLEAARRRGGDPSEVRLAASIFDRLLTCNIIETPDPGSTISVDLSETDSGPMTVSVDVSESGAADMKAFFEARMNSDERLNAHRRATETAARRIQEARQSGASLYLTYVDVEDLEVVLRHAPDLIAGWLEGSEELSTDFRRRVGLAEAAYLALCEAMLNQGDDRGAALWRNLSQVLTTHFMGTAGIDELVHMAFRSPDCTSRAKLRSELISLSRCNNDKELLDIAIAAHFNGRADWLSTIIQEDKVSHSAWQRKRGPLLEGFISHNALPIDDAWPEGEIRTRSADINRHAARSRYRESCAHYWWRQYLRATNVSEVYAAWVLFLCSADRRAWVWISSDLVAANDSSVLFQQKVNHIRLNQSKIKGAMEKNEEKLSRERLGNHFLGRKIFNGIDPWRQYPE